jgi:hypothetical protein
LYQGQLLTELLNWAGLLVNGFIAFLLPVVASYYYFTAKDSNQVVTPQSNSIQSTGYGSINSKDIELASRGELPNDGLVASKDTLTHSASYDSNFSDYFENQEAHDSTVVSALWPSFIPYRMFIIKTIFWTFTIMIVLTIFLDIYTGSGP